MFARSAPPTQEEEGKDVFAPVADLMVGVIFIFIILMLGLVINLQNEDVVSRSEYALLEARNVELSQRLEQEASLRAAAEGRERLLAEANARLEENNAQLVEAMVRLSEANARLTEFARFVRDSDVMRVMGRLARADLTRSQLLEELRSRLAAESIEVTVNTGLGTLMLPSRRLFGSGSADPTPAGRATILQLGRVMSDVLPCYSYAPNQGAQRCSATDEASRLSAVYIEGHTDVEPFQAPGARFRDNWDLSAGRAISAFRIVGDQFEDLRSLRGKDGDPLLGVSGYADTRAADRTVADRRAPDVMDKDRRIEVRVIMATNEELVDSVLRELDVRLRQIDDLTAR